MPSAGGHVPGTPTLELLEWELGGAALSALGLALEQPALPMPSGDSPSSAGPLGARLSERGVLQLLFDIGLLRAATAGGRPAAAAETQPGHRYTT